MISENDVQFTQEQIEIIKRYLNEEWFKELNSLVDIYDEEASIEEQIDHVRKYFYYFFMHDKENINEQIEYFISFLESYAKKEYREPIRDERGIIKLYESGFNSGNGFYMERKKYLKRKSFKGHFLSGVFVTTDGKVFIKKQAMDAMGQMHDLKYHEQSKYNGIVAKEVFEMFGEKSASYLPAIEKSPYYYVISENFLKENQELITLDDLYNDNEVETHSEILELLETNLRIRYRSSMPEEEFKAMCEKVKLQYLKQAFIKKIIGLKDDKPENLGIVLTIDEPNQVIPDIEMSPAFDLDMSFNMAAETGMFQFRTENEKTDIKSFMEEFKDFPGFQDFINSIVNTIQNPQEIANTILSNAYNTSKVRFLSDGESSRQTYIGFLKEKFVEVNKAYTEVYLKSNEKGEEDDVKTILD